jgi:murein DD-endopeptidase MepM/ murein hydrolase activator NlpD
MTRDDRFYAFIVDHTSRSRNRIRKISIHKRWLKVSACLGLILCCAALYGFYGLAQRVVHARIERENNRLRQENEKQRQQLNQLENRVEAIEDASRRLKEMSGVTEQDENSENMRGAGGPLLLMDAETIAAVEYRAAFLEKELQSYESVLRERERVPSIWPVEGRITDAFGVRGNPFGGGSSEFHSGQDIAAPWGTGVVAAATGTVAFAGTQSGYGQIVIVDHGNGMSTRYGHLSRIEVELGQQVMRGTQLGSVGSTGRSTGPHLHYEVRINEAAVSPRRYLPDESDFSSKNAQ